MISVRNKSRNNQKLLTQFKSLVNAENIIEDYKKKQYYIKPSLKKNLKREAAERQRAKDLLEEIRDIQKHWDDLF